MNQIFRDASPYHGFLGQPQTPEQLKAIVEAAVLAEREACAKLVLDDAYALTFQTFGQYRTALAAAIRARGDK